MMPRLLVAIDSSAGPASVALFRDDVLITSRRIERNGSAELLAPTVADLLQIAGAHASDITDVVAGAGPGSFTGLRVAAAFAKGLAHGRNVALHAVPSLPLIAAAADDAPIGSYHCVLDALRGEWFVQHVTRHDDASFTVDGAVERLPVAHVQERAAASGARLVGPPVDVTQQPDVRAALRIGLLAVSRATWEPDYGRLAEAQVVWEATHLRALPTS